MAKLPKIAQDLIGPVESLEKARDLLSMLWQSADSRARRDKIGAALEAVMSAQRGDGTLPRELW